MVRKFVSMDAAEIARQTRTFEEHLRDRLTHVDWRNEVERQRVYDLIGDQTRHRCDEFLRRGEIAAAEGLQLSLGQAVEACEQRIHHALVGSTRQHRVAANGTSGKPQRTAENLVTFPNKDGNRPAPPPLPQGQSPRAERAPERRSIIGPLIFGSVLAGVLGLQLWQMFGPGFGFTQTANCSLTSESCFDSGWQPVSNKASAIYFYRHKLGMTPRIVSAWFSPTADGKQAYSLSQSFPSASVGNPITVEVRSDIVLFHTWSGAPIHGVYDGSTEKWTTYAEGYYRIVAIK